MKIPRPHYVDSNSIRIEGRKITATCRFPSSDPSVGDRVDHVNVAHGLFATWNVAHPLCESLGLRKPLATKLQVKASDMIKPDTDYKIQLELKKILGSKRLAGVATSSIQDFQGKEFLNISMGFVAQKA